MERAFVGMRVVWCSLGVRDLEWWCVGWWEGGIMSFYGCGGMPRG